MSGVVKRLLSHTKLPWYTSNGFTFVTTGMPAAPMAGETTGVATDSEGIAWHWDPTNSTWKPQSAILWFLDNFPNDTTARGGGATPGVNNVWYYICSLGAIPFAMTFDITWVASIKRLTNASNGLQEWYPEVSVSSNGGSTWTALDAVTPRMRPWPGTTLEQRPFMMTAQGTWTSLPITDFRIRLRMQSGGGPGSANYLNGKLMVVGRPYTEDVESSATVAG